MRRFEHNNEGLIFDDRIVARYDVPTVYSEYGQCGLPDPKMPLTTFIEKVRARGVDVGKYRSIILRAYADMVPMDKQGADAVDSVLRTVTWKERAHRHTSSSLPSITYERRENGYE